MPTDPARPTTPAPHDAITPAAAPAAAGREVPPITPAQAAVIRETGVAMGTIRRAAAVASFSGWTTAIGAVISLALAAAGGWVNLAAAAVLGVVAFNELRGRRMLLRLDLGGPLLLAINQGALALAAVAYAGWGLWEGTSAYDAKLAEIAAADPELAETLASMVRGATAAVYVTIGFVGFLVPGLTALYYYSRRPVIARLRRTTPAWARDVFGAA